MIKGSAKERLYRDFAISLTIRNETSFDPNGNAIVDRDPRDPGGTTKFGIDQRDHADVRVENLTLEDAVKIYQEDWEKNEVWKHEPCFAVACMDLGTLFGRQLSQTFTTNADTLERLRDMFYGRVQEIQNENPSLGVFVRGWTNRIEHTYTFCLTLRSIYGE